MFCRFRLTLRRCLLFALLLAAGLAVYFLHISMVAFQKAAMITPADVVPVENFVTMPAPENRPPLDVRELLGHIPYQSSKPIYDIFPPDRYRKTIEMGYGNCSNLVFGMSFLLLKRDYPFQIVHLIPYEGFLQGSGHTVLNMPYVLDGAEHVGIVDVLEGGVPQSNGRFIDLPALQQKHLQQWSIFPLNRHKDDASIYYGEFLDKAALGVVPGTEVANYFSFVDRIYVPLGHKRLERVVFSGIAIVAGAYPHTYVSRGEYARLFAGATYLPTAAQLLIWLMRIIPCLALLSLISYLLARRLPVSAKAQSACSTTEAISIMGLDNNAV